MFRNAIFIALVCIVAASCSSVRPAASRQTASSSRANPSGSVQFINNIAINPEGRQAQGSAVSQPSAISSVSYNNRAAGRIENFPAMQFKYAILENASVEELNNSKLLSFMDYWYGAPYHYGGESRDGIDCSAFALLLMSSVYGVTLPRTSKEQYTASRHISRDELREGDLVFFHTLGRRRVVTHVGVYLRNNKFIHASLSGVMISDMNDSYYDRHFVGAGRVLEQPGSEQDPATSGR